MAPSDDAHSLLRSDRLSRDFVAVGADDTVAQALEKMRATPGTNEIFYCYACDEAGRLFLFRRFHVDPHLAAAPLVLAISDNITLFTYFTLVTWLLG